MRIAYLSRGQTIHDRRFLQQMVSRGHEVHFISYYPDVLVNVPGVTAYHFDDYRVVAPFPRLRSLQTARHLRTLLKKLRPDILHSGWLPDHGFYGALSGFHPTLSMAWGSDVLLDPQRSWSFYWRIRHALSKADHIIANAEQIKAKIMDLTKCGPEKISLFAFGIELDIFRPSSRGEEIRRAMGWAEREVLVMTRSLKAIYGVNYFIEALPRILKARPSLGVILTGSGVDGQLLRRRVEELGLDDAVQWVGPVPDSQRMCDYLNAADVYVSTSLSDGASSSLLEALACALPVVVTDLPPNREWVQDGRNGFLVPPRDVDAIADRIIRLLEEKDLRHAMGERNLALARERADWDKNFSILEQIYFRLAGSKRN